MKKCYDVVKAESREEAAKKSDWKVGDYARVCEVVVIANANGTYTTYPLFEKMEEDVRG